MTESPLPPKIADAPMPDRPATPKIADAVMMPLAAAHLCSDCNLVSNMSDACPGCASRALMALAPILDRKPLQIPPEWTKGRKRGELRITEV